MAGTRWVRGRLAATAATLVCASLPAFAPAASAGLGPPTIVAVPNPFPANDAAFGDGVAGLGDLNGDGVGDLAVGAPGAGRVDLLSGSDRSVIRTIADPDALAGGGFGFAVTDAGDVNADGTDDVAVGAPGSCFGSLCLPPPCPLAPCPPDPNAGRAFIFSGTTGAPLRILAPSSELDGYHHGFALASLGDVNDDAIPDMAVSAPVIGLPAFGEVRAFSGADGTELWVAREPPFPGPKPDAGSFGMFLGAVDDITGDGRPDVLVGAPLADLDPDPSVSDLRGQAHLLSGASGALVRTHQDPTGEFFGGGVGAIGDQNGDGFEDYAVGDRGASEVRIFSGEDGTLLHSISLSASAGYSIAGSQDWNGDGVDDLWVGSVGTGAVYLATGAGTVLASAPDPAADPPMAPPQDMYGWSIAVTDDLGADPQRDLIVGNGAEAVGVYPGAGSAYLVLLCADTKAPMLIVTISPSVLWPPNHTYRTVVATVTVVDDIDTNLGFSLVSVTSNEADDGVDDGNTVNDIVVVDDHTFLLRAERSSSGTGRIYTITYSGTDACGNTGTATAIVSVPISSP
jgi:FG-GAP repeat